MTQKKQKSFSEKNKDPLGKALRENLLKRKAQKRSRQTKEEGKTP
jgi:hypothetical protein